MAQNDIISTKGCKRNPYTVDEYGIIPTNEWSGGWVLNSETGAIEYYNSSHHKTQTINKGNAANPYTDAEYSDLSYNEQWPGGWIKNSQNSIRNVPINAPSGDWIPIGKQQNPYYDLEFQSMMHDNHWYGGWVEYEDGGKFYINAQGEEDEDPEGSGSGGGSGSGSGSGGLRSGSTTYHPSSFPLGCDLVISWESGVNPAISAGIIFNHSSPNAAVNLNAVWDNGSGYRIHVTGTLNLTGQSSGQIYGTWDINEYYQVPGSYFN